MPQKFPSFAVDVTQIDTADDARLVQVSEVSNVCCIFRNLLQGGEVTMTGICKGLITKEPSLSGECDTDVT